MLTPEREKAILDAVKAGVPYNVAAQANGISYDTFARWARLGQDQSDDPAKEPYRQFYKALREAAAYAEHRLIVLWSGAAATDWRAARDLLDRRFAWHQKARIEVEVGIDTRRLLADTEYEAAAETMRSRLAAISGDIEPDTLAIDEE